MYKVEFYEDKNGRSEVFEFINNLEKRSFVSKKNRIDYNKIAAYINMLQKMGTRVGEPVTKHLDGEIWELRPLKNRLLYAYYKDDTFVILHHFIKKTRKTPKRELEKAKRNLQDYIERKGGTA